MAEANKKKFKTRRISGIKLVGEKLKTKRIKKRISLERAEDETKIRVKYLDALENDNYDIFSSQIYALGFLRRYADFLGMDADVLIKEQESLLKNYPKRPNRLTPNTVKKTSSFVITSRFLTISFIVICILGIVGYVGFQVKKFSDPPMLNILNPVNNATVKTEDLEIVGKTDSGAIILINDEQITPMASGDFKKTIKLIPGINTIQVVAKNRVDKISAVELKVFYEPVILEIIPSPSPSVDIIITPSTSPVISPST